MQEVFAALNVREMRKLGLDAVAAFPEDLEWRGGKLRAKGRTVDVLYRMMHTDDCLARAGEIAPLLQAVRERAVCMVNPFRSELLSHKFLFALLTDDGHDFGFTEEEAAAIRAHIPWGRILREDRTTDPSGQAVDLVDYVAGHRENLVLKPAHAAGGTGVHLGWACDQAQWADAVREALAGGYVVQEKVEVSREEYPCFEEGFPLKMFYEDTDPFHFPGGYSGVMTRISVAEITNMAQGGASSPPSSSTRGERPVTGGKGSKTLLIASVAVAVFMARLDTYIVNISLPAMARDFGVGTSAVSWVTMGFLLFNCGSMMLVGRLADIVPPRKLFVWGYAVFTTGSLLCGLAPRPRPAHFFPLHPGARRRRFGDHDLHRRLPVPPSRRSGRSHGRPRHFRRPGHRRGLAAGRLPDGEVLMAVGLLRQRPRGDRGHRARPVGHAGRVGRREAPWRPGLPRRPALPRGGSGLHPDSRCGPRAGLDLLAGADPVRGSRRSAALSSSSGRRGRRAPWSRPRS